MLAIEKGSQLSFLFFKEGFHFVFDLHGVFLAHPEVAGPIQFIFQE